MSQVYNETEDSITADLCGNMPDTYQTTIGFPIGDFFKAIAIILKPLWDTINYILSMMMDLSNWELADLIKYVEQRRNIKYKYATYSSGLVDLTGDFAINTGDLFASAGGLEFAATESVVSVNGAGSVNVQCTTAGSAGNVGVGAITLMPLTLAGVTSVTNNAAFTNGYDAETKESLLQRYYDDLAMPLTSGNKFFYKKWALECPGVGNAYVIPLWSGANTVKVIIIDSNSQPASVNLVNTVQNYIDPGISGTGEGQAPIGAYCTVVSASALNINIAANVSYVSGYDINTVNSAIQANIKNYLKDIAFNQAYVSYAKIGDLILNTAGVGDYNTLKVNNGTANIAVSNAQVAILGTATFTAV